MPALLLTGWLTLTLFVHALDSVGASIEQAQTFTKLRDRQRAGAVLTRAIGELAPAAKSSRARLGEALDQTARVFFTDKGQRAFENGRSLMFENPDLALAQFQTALEGEDQNVSVLESIAKIHLAKSECDAALGVLTKARAIDPIAAEASLLELRAAVCHRAPVLPPERVRTLPPLDKWQEAYLQFLQSAVALDAHANRRASDLALKVTEAFPDFAGAYFVLGRALGELGREREPAFRRYVTLCKAIDAKVRRKFSLEPRLCSHQREVEDELAKGSGDA